MTKQGMYEFGSYELNSASIVAVKLPTLWRELNTDHSSNHLAKELSEIEYKLKAIQNLLW